MDEGPGALEVGQELVAEPDTFARPLDQPGHVGHDHLAAVRRFDRAENWLECRECIVGHLRPGVRDPRQKRRLPRVRKADERGVGEQLQVQLDVELVAGEADLGEAGHLARRAHETRVAAATGTATRENDARAGMREIGDQLVAVANLRPDGNPKLDVGPVGAVLTGATTVAALERNDHPPALVHGKIPEGWVGEEDDVAAIAAIAAVWPALGHVLLAAKRQATVASSAGLDMNFRAVAEHGHGDSVTRRRGERADARELRSGLFDDRHEAALAARAELGLAGSQREDRVVAADRRAWAGAELRPALADDDLAGLHVLACKDLHAEILGIRVAAVPR